MTKIFLGCMGQYLRGRELAKYGQKVLSLVLMWSVLNGRCYVRSLKGMLLRGKKCSSGVNFSRYMDEDELEILRRQASSRDTETSDIFHASVSWSFD